MANTTEQRNERDVGLTLRAAPRREKLAYPQSSTKEREAAIPSEQICSYNMLLLAAAE